MIVLDKFEGHIVLYCKGHYRQENLDFITGLRRIWAIRCGIGIEHIDSSFDEYIADFMFRIIQKTLPKKLDYLHEIMHRYLARRPLFSNEEELPTMIKLINFYSSEIQQLQIKERVKVNYKVLIRLPKPQKRLFNRIVKGQGKYTDYDLIK